MLKEIEAEQLLIIKEEKDLAKINENMDKLEILNLKSDKLLEKLNSVQFKNIEFIHETKIKRRCFS